MNTVRKDLAVEKVVSYVEAFGHISKVLKIPTLKDFVEQFKAIEETNLFLVHRINEQALENSELRDKIA